MSLPEGTASVVGLTAMMTDHYAVLVRAINRSNSYLISVFWVIPNLHRCGPVQDTNFYELKTINKSDTVPMEHLPTTNHAKLSCCFLLNFVQPRGVALLSVQILSLENIV